MVAVGDTVEEEQSLITVEGDKASMEVPAPFAGTVKEIKIAAGDKVSTGSLIMVFEVAGAAPAPAAAPAQAAAPAAPLLKQKLQRQQLQQQQAISKRTTSTLTRLQLFVV